MTIQELYDWAVKNNLTNADIYVRDGDGEYLIATDHTAISPDSPYPRVDID